MGDVEKEIIECPKCRCRLFRLEREVVMNRHGGVVELYAVCSDCGYRARIDVILMDF